MGGCRDGFADLRPVGVDTPAHHGGTADKIYPARPGGVGTALRPLLH
jgi:hypothetical protein